MQLGRPWLKRLTNMHSRKHVGTPTPRPQSLKEAAVKDLKVHIAQLEQARGKLEAGVIFVFQATHMFIDTCLSLDTSFRLQWPPGSKVMSCEWKPRRWLAT